MERFGDYMQIDCELVTFDLNSRLSRQAQKHCQGLQMQSEWARK